MAEEVRDEWIRGLPATHQPPMSAAIGRRERGGGGTPTEEGRGERRIARTHARRQGPRTHAPAPLTRKERQKGAKGSPTPPGPVPRFRLRPRPCFCARMLRRLPSSLSPPLLEESRASLLPPTGHPRRGYPHKGGHIWAHWNHKDDSYLTGHTSRAARTVHHRHHERGASVALASPPPPYRQARPLDGSTV